MSILEQIKSKSEFAPENVAEYFALRLAQRLGDAENARWYANICYRLGLDSVLAVFRRVLPGPKNQVADRFREAVH
jgi:hypothetical protein